MHTINHENIEHYYGFLFDGASEYRRRNGNVQLLADDTHGFNSAIIIRVNQRDFIVTVDMLHTLSTAFARTVLDQEQAGTSRFNAAELLLARRTDRIKLSADMCCDLVMFALSQS